MRVFYSRRSIERSGLVRLTQIDYAREMAFVAVDTAPDGVERTLGVVRAVADPDNVSAEFGIVIRSDLKGLHLGSLLMQRIIDYQREHGTKKLVATVLADDTRMLDLAHRMGFVEKPNDQGDGIRYDRAAALMRRCDQRCSKALLLTALGRDLSSTSCAGRGRRGGTATFVAAHCERRL